MIKNTWEIKDNELFPGLAITNKVVKNIVKQVSLWYDRASFGHIPKNGIAGYVVD